MNDGNDEGLNQRNTPPAEQQGQVEEVMEDTMLAQARTSPEPETGLSPEQRRTARNQEITRQIHEGTYYVAPEEVAKSILRDIRKRRESMED